MNKEYIERDAAVAFLENMEASRYLIQCFESKERFPAADVAPIIRCKYCIHYEPYRKPVEDFDGRCSAKGHETDETEFCSYGAKMDGGNSNGTV